MALLAFGDDGFDVAVLNFVIGATLVNTFGIAIASMASGSSRAALTAGHDAAAPTDLRVFFYLPFEHSEALADQDQSVALCTALDAATGTEWAKWAEMHRDIIAQHGRFPHRNACLGRASTAREQAFLDAGGFAG